MVGVRAGVARRVDHRVHEDLRGETGPVAAGGERRGRGEVAPRAVAGDGDARRIARELGGVLREPVRDRHAVVEGCGEAMLGSEAIVDAHDDRVRGVRQSSTDAVVGVEPHHHEAATVEVRDDR